MPPVPAVSRRPLKRQQTVPAACICSAFRDLETTTLSAAKHHLQWHHRQVRSILSQNTQTSPGDLVGDERTLVSKGDCSWDKGSAQCSPSLEKVVELLQNTEDPYGQLVVESLECDEQTEKTACRLLEECYWDKRTESCSFKTDVSRFKDSPCVEAALVTLSLTAYTEKCEAFDENACAEAADCSWDEEDQVCGIDTFYLFFGFKFDDLAPAFRAVAHELSTMFYSEFEIDDPDFQPDAILDWDTSNVTCPGITSEMLCNLAKVEMGFVMPAEFYCELKYNDRFSFPDCIADPLCHYAFQTSSCEAHEDQFAVATGKTLQTASPSVEHSVDREFMSSLGECMQHLTEDSCSGDCYWDSSKKSSSCSIAPSAIASMLAEPGKGGSDPLCMLLDAFAGVDCKYRSSKEDCIATENCTWKRGSGCDISGGYLALTVTKKDSDFEESYNELASLCAEKKKRRACARFHRPRVFVA